MKRIYISIFILLVFSVFSPSTNAQSWQWGDRGGSSGNFSTSDDEFVKDMAVDRNGNLYVLANTGSTTSIDIAGQTKTGLGEEDIVLVSFKCDGSLRWIKFFGTAEYDDYGFAIETDKLDGVYISGRMFRGPQKKTVYIDGDKIINGNDEKAFYFIKYDTSGNFKWVHSPQPDTVTATQQAGLIDMHVDSAGNLFALCQVPPGLYGGSFTATQKFTAQGNAYEDCMLKYDKNGNFLGGMSFDTKGCYGAQMTMDAKTGNYYLCGTTGGNPLPMGNASVAAGSGYIACFGGPESKYLWDIQSNATSLTGRLVLDKDKNMYVCGLIRSPSTSNPNANFNGYIAQSHPNISNGSPFIVKIDSSRVNKWATYSMIKGVSESKGLALRNSGEIIVVGHFPGYLAWPGYTTDTFDFGFNTGYRPFITRFNTQTGKVLGMETLSTDSNDTYTNVTISDGRNNLYIGGEITYKLKVNGDDLTSVGGETDWYVAKYGHNNCNCTNIPEPKFSVTKNAINDLNFTYTGSSYSTIEWDFDDGNTSTQAAPNHVYAQGGTYTICVKVTNSCGDNTYCQFVDTWPAGVSNSQLPDNIHIYPNPANDVLQIEGVELGTKITMYDMMGRNVYSTVSKNQKENINISSLPSGNYIIQLTSNDGQRTIGKIVKR